MTAPLILNVNVHNWMKPIHPSNDQREFYLVGDVTNFKHTQCVTLTTDPTQRYVRMLLCTLHNVVYAKDGRCSKCDTPPSDDATTTRVTKA